MDFAPDSRRNLPQKLKLGLDNLLGGLGRLLKSRRDAQGASRLNG